MSTKCHHASLITPEYEAWFESTTQLQEVPVMHPLSHQGHKIKNLLLNTVFMHNSCQYSVHSAAWVHFLNPHAPISIKLHTKTHPLPVVTSKAKPPVPDNKSPVNPTRTHG